MDRSIAVSVAAVAVVLATLALTSPAVGVVALGDPGETDLGEGTATVGDASFEHDPVLTPGRFGTAVAYLRIPDATVRLSAVEGRSRLVYQVRVPALDFERVANRPLSPRAGDTVRVGMADRAFQYKSITRETYRATLVLRVQSFAVDRTVVNRTVTVEVRTDG